jgi:hypothetical protein
VFHWRRILVPLVPRDEQEFVEIFITAWHASADRTLAQPAPGVMLGWSSIAWLIQTATV